MGWNVVLLKYGKKLERVFSQRGGDVLRQWIDDCPNDLYSALTFKGQSGEKSVWRAPLKKDLRGVRGLKSILEDHDDDELHLLMTNLAGHDMESVLEAFNGVKDDTPQCFIAYTIKDWVKENHPECKWIVTFPTDTPFFPMDLASKLYDAVSDNKAELPRFRQMAAEAGREPDTLPVTSLGLQPENDIVSKTSDAGIDRVVFGLPPEKADTILPMLDKFSVMAEKYS